MSSLEKVIELFKRFPGIGPRQAQRFVYFLLAMPPGFRKELADAIASLGNDAKRCLECGRFFSGSNHTHCSICSDTARSAEQLLVVAKDIDLTNVERSGLYSGRYFVLGGTIPVLSKAPAKYIATDSLKKLVEKRVAEGLQEIILAFPANPDGEHTEREIRTLLSPITDEHGIIISALGRGLSTGAELEYVDRDTIRGALQNRS